MIKNLKVSSAYFVLPQDRNFEVHQIGVVQLPYYPKYAYAAFPARNTNEVMSI